MRKRECTRDAAVVTCTVGMYYKLQTSLGEEGSRSCWKRSVSCGTLGHGEATCARGPDRAGVAAVPNCEISKT